MSSSKRVEWLERTLASLKSLVESPTLAEEISYVKVNLMGQIVRCQRSVGDPQLYADNVRQLVNMIPDSWRDEKFEHDLKKAYFRQRIESPIQNCGVPVTNCPELPPRVEIVEDYDWEAVFHAVINLLDRLQVLAKREYREVFMGIKFDDARELAKRLMEASEPPEEAIE